MLLPGLFPPTKTVHHHLLPLVRDGRLEVDQPALLLMAREAAGREATPSAPHPFEWVHF